MKLVVAILMIAVIAAPARADDEASAHFSAGVALAKRGDHAAALAEFEEAYELTGAWEYLFNIGVTQKTLFRYGAAIRTLEQYLREGGDQVTADRATKVATELSELRRLVGEVVVLVEGAPAQIEIDGLFEGVTPLDAPLFVAPGDHTIRALRDGELPDERAISVVSGERVEVALAPRLPEQAPTTARITITTDPPGAQVSVDGGPAIAAPWTGELPAGGHRVIASLRGFRVEDSEFGVDAGQDRTLPLALERLPPEGKPIYKKPAFWITVGAVALVGAVGGIVYAAQPEDPDVVLRWHD